MDSESKKDEILRDMQEREKRKIDTYNKSLINANSKINIVEEKYEKKENLKQISWQLYEIDREALEDFKRNHDCTYQDIIKYALRYYLGDTNYRHAKEILELKEKQDKEENDI